MTETNTESGLPAADALAAKPAVAAGQGVEPASGSAGQPEVNLQELYKTVQEIGATVKTLQSGKDRGVNKALGEVENMKGQIEKIMDLAGRGMDAAGIARKLNEVSVEDRIETLNAKIDQLLGLGGNGMPNNPTAEQRKVIEEIGLGEDDPAVTRAIRSGLRGAELKAELALAALAKTKRPSPGASSALPLSNGTVEQKNDFDVSNIEDSEKLYKLAAQKEFGG